MPSEQEVQVPEKSKKNTIQASEEKTHSSSAVLSCDILPENVVILVRTVEFQLKPRQQILNHDV